MNLARKAASVAMCAALALFGAVGIVGMQAFAPTDTGLVQQAEAKIVTKAGWYEGILTGVKKGNRFGDAGTIYRAKISGSKLVVQGRLARYGSAKMRYGTERHLGYAKRSFKLSARATFRAVSGEGSEKFTRAKFKRYLANAQSSHLGLRFKVVSGKVAWIQIRS